MMNYTGSKQLAGASLTSRQRWESLAEVVVATFVVIGHNIIRILPNEVPVLFVLYCISSRVRDGKWSIDGLRRPKSWLKTVGMATVAAAIMLIGSAVVIQPLANHIWHRPERVSSLLQVPAHDWRIALRNLVIVWVFAGFGEEIGYRGYLLTRAADLGNRSKLSYIIAMVYVSALFGLGHSYKGLPGIVDSAFSGLVLGGIYLLSGRNLWTSILAHGIKDTVAVLVIFMGWAT